MSRKLDVCHLLFEGKSDSLSPYFFLFMYKNILFLIFMASFYHLNNFKHAAFKLKGEEKYFIFVVQ